MTRRICHGALPAAAFRESVLASGHHDAAIPAIKDISQRGA